MIDLIVRDHKYYLNGVPYPSVTQILKKVNLLDSTWFTDEGSERGIRVHSITEAIDDPVHPYFQPEEDSEFSGFIEAYRKFLKETKITYWHIEIPIVSVKYRFGGTPDRIGVLDGVPCVLDIKSGAKASWHGIQLAGYEIIAQEHEGGLKTKKRCLYIRGDGTYRLEALDDPVYRDIFMSALNVYGWIENEK